jgi:hypothetical protein
LRPELASEAILVSEAPVDDEPCQPLAIHSPTSRRPDRAGLPINRDCKMTEVLQTDASFAMCFLLAVASACAIWRIRFGAHFPLFRGDFGRTVQQAAESTSVSTPMRRGKPAICGRLVQLHSFRLLTNCWRATSRRTMSLRAPARVAFCRAKPRRLPIDGCHVKLSPWRRALQGES